jgi:D-glycero-D-manno-heptose 1,7-bisphosphate phosphatase
MRKAIFLDKDGTLIENVHYNVNPDRIRLLPYAAEALSSLQKNNFMLIVISNQSGVALGYFTEAALLTVNKRIRQLLEQGSVSLEAFYYCTHHTSGTVPLYAKKCNCRKPAPGMLIQASRDYDIDLRKSWMIGDILDDVEAGNRAGCKTILIDNGNETEWRISSDRIPDFIAKDLKHAAQFII